jgi:endonuclease/exonuclease/phosphatase (EEP) superfamily protein YafD
MQYSRDGKLEQYNFLQRLAAKIYSKLFTDRLKTDYMFYKNLRLKKIERIKVRFSDHFPIIAYFSE